VHYQTQARENETQSLKEQKNELENSMFKDLKKANNQIINLKKQLKIAEEGVTEAEKISRMTYDTYKSGKANFLDVQSMNLKELEWKVNLAILKVQLLIQLSIVENLTSQNLLTV